MPRARHTLLKVVCSANQGRSMPRSDAFGGGPEGSQPLAPGIELAGYRIESFLGRGGMGVVYRARDLALDRNVALKLLAPELASDVRFRERFLRESRLA